MSRVASVVLLLSLTLAGSALAAIPEAERQVLFDLYNSTGGPGWTDRTRWLGEPGTECTWKGISCDAGQTTVTGVQLHFNNLAGTLPASISQLRNLLNLSLQGNKLTGPVPSTLGGLSQLKVLYLHQNRFTGTIPAELGSLSSLETLQLSNNQLSGSIPPALGSLARLTSLYASTNQLSGEIPPEIGSLSALQNLGLGTNQLSGSIPPALGNLTELLSLGLGNNHLEGPIPSNMSRLTKLQEVYLGGGQLSGPIPAWFGQCRDLTKLHLWGNQFSGTIPAELGNISKLFSLMLDGNDLSGPIPSSLGQLTNLLYLYLTENRLSGDIPDLGGLTKLQEFDISLNPELGPGPFPAWVSRCPDLVWLNLQNTKRTGGLPDLGSCTKLQYLFIGDNPGLSPGPLPPGLSALKALRWLDLSSTNRTGNFPDMGGATQLAVLRAGDNPQMGPGPIPAWLSGMPALADLQLANTNRTGEIPDLGASPKLVVLDLSYNSNLSAGPIPAWLAGLSALEALSLMKTNRTGAVPDLSRLTKLDSLMLSSNPQLTAGPIPAWVTGLPLLSSLGLGGTSRTGAIPDLSALPLVALDLNDNPQLEPGPIPSWITGKPGLMALFLRNSNRTGPIPEGLGNLTALRLLALSSNQLTGEIPASLVALTSLGDIEPSMDVPAEFVIPLDLRWNALYSKDPQLVSFLNSKQVGGDWQGTQTVAPSNPTASPEGQSSIRLAWPPISYTADPGFYEVLQSTTPGGPYVLAGATNSKTATSYTVTGLTAGTTYHLAVRSVTLPHNNNLSRVSSDNGTPVAVKAGCAPVTAPSINSVPGGPVTPGASFTVARTPVLEADAGGTYQVEVAANESCSSPVRILTQQPSVTILTESGKSATYCVVVLAVSSQGCASDRSAPATVSVQALPPTFSVVGIANALSISRGAAAPVDVSVTLRNVGGSPGAVTLSGVPGFFDPIPASQAPVVPGQDIRVQIQFASGISATTGLKLGSLLATWNGGSLSTPVSLTVLEMVPESSAGSPLSYQTTNEVHFRYLGGGNPPPQDVTIANAGTKPVSVAPRIGPGGGWLSVAGDFATPIPPGGTRTFRLSVDRSKRTESDGAPPLVTNLVFLNLGGDPGDAAYGQVFDEEAPPPAPGASRPALSSGEFSLILGSAVSARGQGATFVSDTWIQNRGAAPATADLFFTPNGQDGISSDLVKKASISLGPYSTQRLSDFVKGLFEGQEVSGQVEIRSAQLPQISARSAADAITEKPSGLARYGAEIPVVLSGQGVKKGTVAILAGLRDKTSGFRSNVILSETSGKGAAVRLRLFDQEGKLLGQKVVPLQPYSKEQVNSTDTEVFPEGSSYEGGTVEVSTDSGEGSVAVFATVIDNSSGSYATRLGEVFPAEGTDGLGQKAGPKTTALQTAFLPAATRSEALNNSFYRTRLVMANIGRTAVKLTLTYLPDAGGPGISKDVTLPARAEGPRAWSREDVLGELFGVRENSSGMIRFEGELGAISIASETSTPLDLNDPAKGRSVSAFNPAPGKPETEAYGVYSKEAAEVIGTPSSGSSRAVVTHPAIEEGFAFRTNLILAELSGEAAEVKVRVVRSGTGGATLGERTYSLSGFQRLQKNKVLRDILGIASDDPGAEFKDIEIEIQAVGGKGRILAIITKIDNNPASKRADIYTLGGAAMPAGTPVSEGN